MDQMMIITMIMMMKIFYLSREELFDTSKSIRIKVELPDSRDNIGMRPIYLVHYFLLSSTICCLIVSPSPQLLYHIV